MCLFEATDGTFLRARFSTEDDTIILETMERLVIDEDSEEEKRLKILEGVFKAVVEDDSNSADRAMDEYIAMDIARSRRDRYNETQASELTEDYKVRLYNTRGHGGMPKLFARKGSKNTERSRAAKLGHARHPSSYRVGASKRRSHLSQERAKRHRNKSSVYHILKAKSADSQYTGTRKKKMLAEWLRLSTNVFGFMEHLESGSAMAETRLVENKDGTNTLVIPNAQRA